MNYVICHYGEIALKGKNRWFFEEKLVENIKKALPPDSFELVKRISGRILIKLTPHHFSQKSGGGLKNVFGIVYFAFAQSCPQKIDLIKKKALELLKDKKFTPLEINGLKKKHKARKSLTGFKTFKISTQRSKKDFALTSTEVNEKIGAEVVKKLKKKVDLNKPDITLFIEIVEEYAFLYFKKIRGLGGLPVGVSGRAVVLLSGGIDSPVAAFLMLKRGVKIIFLHFHAYPYTNKASIEKVKQIVKVLQKFQPDSKLFLAPFAGIQKEILLKTPCKLRVILYRRMMLRIAKKLAEKEKALAIVTGESIGQVASQTLENIKVIEEAADLPVLRPLITYDKEEIIKMAKKIGTFALSILADQDCCVRFLPKHPATRAKLEEVKEAETKLALKELVKVCYNKPSREISTKIF